MDDAHDIEATTPASVGREGGSREPGPGRPSAAFTRFPHFPLLPRPMAVTIAEQHVNAGSMAAFSSGYLLARMHAGRFMHGDFHPRNALFDVRSGTSRPIDSEVGFLEDFEARHAATEFRQMTRMTRGSFEALVIGYGKALAARDPSTRFSPEEIFALVGVEADYAVRVDPRPGWADRVAACLTLEVTDTDSVVTVGCSDPGQLRALIVGESRRCGALAVALALLNYDASPLWLGMTQSSDADPVVRRLAKASEEGPGYAGGGLDPDVILAEWAIWLAALPSEPGSEPSAPPSAADRRGSVEGGLVRALRMVELLASADPEWRLRGSRLMDDTLCMVDAFALAWDWRGSRRWLSQSAAQLAQILLRAAAGDPLRDECRELAMAARHSKLSWFRKPALGTVDVSVYLLDRLSTLTVLLARTIPARTSRDPVPYPGVQWSLAWRGLALTRNAIRGRIKPAGAFEAIDATIDRRFLVLRRELLRHYSMALIIAFGAQLMVEDAPFSAHFSDLHADWTALDSLLRVSVLAETAAPRDPRVEAYARQYLSDPVGFDFDLDLPALIAG